MRIFQVLRKLIFNFLKRKNIGWIFLKAKIIERIFLEITFTVKVFFFVKIRIYLWSNKEKTSLTARCQKERKRFLLGVTTR